MTDFVTYSLANLANYKLDIAKIGTFIYDELAYVYKEDFPDVEVKRENAVTDLNLLHSHCLMSVNGYIHATEFIDNRLYIRDATRGMLKAKANKVGILNFTGLAPKGLTKHSISASMLGYEDALLPTDRVLINLPVPVVQPVLILAGYMIPYNTDYFYRISDSCFVLSLNKIQYVEKLYELNRYRDIFKALDIPVSPTNPSMVANNDIHARSAVTKLLTLSNSFMVDVGVDTLHTKPIYLEKSTMPGNFRTEMKPMMPMVVGYGKLGEYSVVADNSKKFTVNVQDAYYNNHLFSAMPSNRLKVLNDHRRVGETYRLSHAYFLEIKA